MFANQHARLKGSTKYVTPPLHYFNDHSDRALERAKKIFGIEVNKLGPHEVQTRCTTSTVSVKVYNFTRQEVTQVGIGGFRAELRRIPYNLDILDEKRRFNIEVPVLNRRNVAMNREFHNNGFGSIDTDLFAVYDLLRECKVNPDEHVVIVQFKRIVAETKEALAESIRSLSADEQMIRNIEVNFNSTIPKGNGAEGFYRDILFVTTIHESDLQENPAVLDTYSGVQVSFLDIKRAPAHTFECSTELVHPDQAGDAIRERKHGVATYVIHFNDYQRLPIFVRDGGMIVQIPQVFDETKQPGFYKTWYEYDTLGRLRTFKSFTPMNKVTDKHGFFFTRTEAELWAPEDEIKEFRDNLLKLVSKFSAQLNNVTQQIVGHYAKRMTKEIDETFVEVREDIKFIKKLEDQLNEARAARERDRQEFDRKLEQARRETERAKDNSNDIANFIKLTVTILTAVTTVIALLRPKKKPS